MTRACLPEAGEMVKPWTMRRGMGGMWRIKVVRFHSDAPAAGKFDEHQRVGSCELAIEHRHFAQFVLKVGCSV